jgi:hypothetical protein
LVRKKTFKLAREVKAIARERVGRVPPAHPIDQTRRKPKHKKLPGAEEDQDTGGSR